jgi:hypothetical protein
MPRKARPSSNRKETQHGTRSVLAEDAVAHAVGTAANARRGGFCPLSGKYSTHPYCAWSSRIGGKASSGAE